MRGNNPHVVFPGTLLRVLRHCPGTTVPYASHAYIAIIKDAFDGNGKCRKGHRRCPTLCSEGFKANTTVMKNIPSFQLRVYYTCKGRFQRVSIGKTEFEVDAWLEPMLGE